MMSTTDLDRQIAGWLGSAGPAEMNPEALDAALSTARATAMGRGLRARLLGPARWPRRGRLSLDALAPSIRIAIVIGLLAAILAGGLIVGSRLLRPQIVTPIDPPRTYQGRITLVAPGLAADGFQSPISLADGQVLSFDDTGPVLWDPDTGRVRSGGPLNAPRFAPIPVILADGRVLIIGGDFTPPDAQGGSTITTPTVEVWDPRTNLSSRPIPLPTASWISAATRLTDGRVLVAGGITTDGTERTVATAALFDPETGAFTPTGSMTTPRIGHSMALLPDGRVVVVGGSAVVSDDPDTSTTEVYDPSTGLFSAGDPLDEIAANPDDTIYPLSSRTPVVGLAGGEVLVPGLRCQEVHAYRADGLSDGVRETPIELFDPATGTFNRHGSMPHCVHQASPLPNGDLYVRGWWYVRGSGEVFTDRPWAGIYDPRTGLVQDVEVPRVNGQNYIHSTVLPDGRVVFFGTGVEVMN